MKKVLTSSLLLGISLFAADYSGIVESPSASKILEKDLLAPAKVFTMPDGCISVDAGAIARGKYIFHNLNSADAKTPQPEGLSKVNEKGKPKQYGNCVACHNIEDAQGAGNIGPDLHKYHENMMITGVRDNQFVYQKISDPRIDNPATHMTINQTTGLFTPREICDIASYVVSPK